MSRRIAASLVLKSTYVAGRHRTTSPLRPVAPSSSRHHVSEPAGFASDATWGQNTSGPHGHALGHCCLSLTLQDFAHLGQLYLDDFVVSGEQMVPSDWVDAVAQPGVGANYSLQFWLPSGHDQEFIARGAFSNYLWTDTARGFTVAQFGTPPPRDALSTAEHAAAMRAIGDALTD